MPKIIKLRRHLVQEQARFPEELLNLFENMEQHSNPWGIAPSERSKWSSQLGERPFAGGQTEYLFFVGCAGAFDNRNKQVSVALASLLDVAGISLGMFGKEELCCGDKRIRLRPNGPAERRPLPGQRGAKDRHPVSPLLQHPE